MNSSLSDIKRRLASVKQTRQITGAMETVSVAKMRKATEKLDGNRAYTKMLYDVMTDIAASESDIDGFFEKPKSGKKLVVVLSSDRGLCGGFDHDIFKCADNIIDGNTTVMPIGKTAGDYYKTRKESDLRFVHCNISEYGNAQKIADFLLSVYGNGINEIAIVYSELIAHTSVTPKVKCVLPIEKPSEKSSNTRMDGFEPSVEEACTAILPLYVSGAVYGAIIENSAAEHCARRAMMSAATKSADEIIGRLSVEYNRSRQAVITEQIVEISGSTEALKKNEKRS